MTSRLLSTVVLCAVTVCTGAANTSRKLLDSGCATPFDQCGGETCMGGRGSTTCVDAAYTCCPSSYTCQRQNSQRWQCMPERTAAGPFVIVPSSEHEISQSSNSSPKSPSPTGHSSAESAQHSSAESSQHYSADSALEEQVSKPGLIYLSTQAGEDISVS